MNADPVRPNVRRLTDADARHLIADGLLRTCHKHGPSRVALETGCDEKTIRRARDEHSTLGIACAMNLLDIDEHALDALIAAKGFRLRRLATDAAHDIIPTSGAVIHKLGMARDKASPGGADETDDELTAMEGDADAMEQALDSLKSRIALAKLRRAA